MKTKLLAGFVLGMLVLSLVAVSAVAIEAQAYAETEAEGSADAESEAQVDGSARGNAGLGVSLGSGVSVESGLNIAVDSGNVLKVTLSDGSSVQILVRSDEAEATAASRLAIDSCEDRCTVQLREVRSSGEARAAYRVETKKEAKVFGLFQTDMNVAANVDAETGTVLSVERPWWAFVAVESTARASANANSNTRVG